ncbi:MAG TPA: hypothetical protein DD643_02695 [Synechococcus sp. UBA8638]|nr:hypothetical protein [Synechococcus sp. UBA8638]
MELLPYPMPSVSPLLVAVAAVAGALAAWVRVIVTVLVVLWNKLDKRLDDLKAEPASWAPTATTAHWLGHRQGQASHAAMG